MRRSVALFILQRRRFWDSQWKKDIFEWSQSPSRNDFKDRGGSGDENGESDLMPVRTVVPRLQDIGMSFRTGMKISLRYDLVTEWKSRRYHVNSPLV